MKAYIMEDVAKPAWADMPKPPLFPKGCIIRPVAVATCTTDVHLCETGSDPRIVGKTMGHEFAGIITEVGPEVKDFKVGDRVCASATQPRWRSLETQEGRGAWVGENHYCDDTPGRGGVFAELYSIMDADMTCAHIPDNVDWESAVMVTDMMTTAFGGVQKMDIHFGDSVAVIGIGPVGLMGVAACKLAGASKVYAVGSREVSFDVAKKYGACAVINYKECDYVEEILKLNGGPVDRVFIAGGCNSTIAKASMLTPMNGNITNVGNFYGDDDVHFPAEYWHWGHSDRTYNFVQAPGGRCIAERMLSLIEAGMIDPKLICKPVLHGIENIETAYKLMLNRDPDILKPVIFLD